MMKVFPTADHDGERRSSIAAASLSLPSSLDAALYLHG
jgi:hypothetical protein